MSVSHMPFLYMTRTILRTPTARAAPPSWRSLHTTARCLKKKTADIPFAHEVGAQDIPLEPAPGGTITPGERRVFERIFADIRARGLQPSVRDDHQARPDPPETAQRSAMLIMQQAAHDAGQARASTIAAPALLAGAANDRTKALLRFPPELRAAASKALNLFDPNSATGTKSPDDLDLDGPAEQWKAPAYTFMRTVEVEAKRLPERRRVERLMLQAKDDQELWDVLENEVFTFPARFGLTMPQEPTPAPLVTPKKAKRGRPSKKAQAEVAAQAAAAQHEIESSTTTTPTADMTPAEPSKEQETTLDDTSLDDISPNPSPSALENDPSQPSPERLSLYIYGPLYPAYLLLALRRLDSAFTSPSPLTYSLLPRIKELGLESYVLGISTPFYNELLEIYWRRRGDLNSMLDLLEEMRHCGLYFDEQTSSILSKVRDEANALSLARRHHAFAAKGKRGGGHGQERPPGTPGGQSLKKSDYARQGFTAAVMAMPEFETSVRTRLNHWARAVDISITERKADFEHLRPEQ